MRNQMYFFPSIALTRMTNELDAVSDGGDALSLSHQCHIDLGHLFCTMGTCKFPGKMFALQERALSDICTNAHLSVSCLSVFDFYSFFVFTSQIGIFHI